MAPGRMHNQAVAQRLASLAANWAKGKLTRARTGLVWLVIVRLQVDLQWGGAGVNLLSL